MKPLIAAWVIASLTSACAGSFDVTGGPTGKRVQVKVARDIRPLVEDDAAALEQQSRLEGREAMGKIFLYAELGMLAGCLLLPRVDSYDLGAGTWTGIGMCAGTLVLGIAAVIVLPGKHAYGESLRVYNRNHPQTPYLAPQLGVTAPATMGQAAAR